MEEISIKPEEFTKALMLAIQDDDAEFRLEDIDDYLISLIEEVPSLDKISEIEVCAKIAVETINPDVLGFSYAWALHSLIACECILGKADNIILNLKELIGHCESIGYMRPCVSAMNNIKNGALGDIAADKYPALMRVIIEYNKKYGNEKEVAKCYMVVAYFFSDREAYRAAIDTLDDALEYLEEFSNKKCMVEVLAVKHSTYITSEDHEYALTAWDDLSKFCKDLDIEPPFHSMVNHATYLMRGEKHDDAIEIYNEALASQDCTSHVSAIIFGNLSACYREKNDTENTIKSMNNAREIIEKLSEDDFDNDFLLEIELINARNNVFLSDSDGLKRCLFSFIQKMDITLAHTFKLHYRRGVRSRYVARFESLVACLPRNGPVTDIIPLLSFSRINQAADWLSILKWREDISGRISISEREKLSNLIDNLSTYGAPHLYGFREKHDNPLYEMNDDPWDSFITFVEILDERYEIPSIYLYSSLKFVTDILNERLLECNVMIFDFSASESKIITLYGGEYIIEDLPETEGSNFFIELNKFRFIGDNKKEFNQSLINYQAAMNNCLTGTISILEENNQGMIFFPSKMDFLPINLLLVSNDIIRNKMMSGTFSISSCLCLHPRSDIYQIKSCLGVVESVTNLNYDRAEILHFMKVTGIKGEILQSPPQNEFFDKSSESDSIIISQHGMSVGMFTDPVFANLSGPHADIKTLSYEILQSNSYKMKHKLVMLNACYSGALVNRNYYKRFRTHELLGYPQAFLLNRKSMVIAASWTIVDRYNALLMHNFSHLISEYGIRVAYSMSLAKTYEMATDEMVSALNEITDGIQPLPNNQALDAMKSHPFCFATYHNYTLL
jgi:tetratricopeptide (TPR) repeat protein